MTEWMISKADIGKGCQDEGEWLKLERHDKPNVLIWWMTNVLSNEHYKKLVLCFDELINFEFHDSELQ